MILPLATLLLLSAQTTGGNGLTHASIERVLYNTEFATTLDNVGDLNADGIDDFVVGDPSTYPSGFGRATAFSGVDGSVLFEVPNVYSTEDFGELVVGVGDTNQDGVGDYLVSSPSETVNGVHSAGVIELFSGSISIGRWEGLTANGAFGYLACAAGDMDGDGIPDFAYNHSNWNIIVRSGATHSIIHVLTIPFVDTMSSISSGGDINNDGFDDLLVGNSLLFTSNHFEINIISGQDGGTLSTLTFPVVAAVKSSLDGGSDFDGDSVPDILVGVNPANSRWNAYVFSGATNAQLGRIQSNYDGGGVSVAWVDDFTGDGASEILIGSPNSTVSGILGAGIAQLFSSGGASLLYTWEGHRHQGHLGESLAALGDMNGDSLPDFVLGAPNELPTTGIGGSVYIRSMQPFLKSSSSTTSAAAGGTVSLDLKFPLAAANDPYRVLLSVTGIGPTYYGTFIPLNRDSYALASYAGSYPFTSTSNMQGNLGATGTANASFTMAPGSLNAGIGRTIYLAAISQPLGQRPEFSSVALPLVIEP